MWLTVIHRSSALHQLNVYETCSTSPRQALPEEDDADDADDADAGDEASRKGNLPGCEKSKKTICVI